jgi:hypothetical protein
MTKLSDLSEGQRQDKLATLISYEGYEDLDAFLEVFALDCVVPAICINPDCDCSAEMEPDQEQGWCECCDENTVVSALVLAGII